MIKINTAEIKMPFSPPPPDPTTLFELLCNAVVFHPIFPATVFRSINLFGLDLGLTGDNVVA